MTPDQIGALVEAGVNRFQHAQFHAAHEPWEAAWLATPDGPLREGLRGLVQWAAAAHHVQLGKGAPERLLARGRTRLDVGGHDLRTLGLRRLLVPQDLVALQMSVQEPGAFLQMSRPRPLPVAAALLAGGHGRRAGGPKALKLKEGQRLWQWQVAQLQALGCAPVVAVLHPDAWEDGQLRADPDAPTFASLQQALRALPERDVLVLPVDCPCPQRATVVELVAAALEAEARGKPWHVARPMHAGRGGHPVLLAAAWQATLLDLSRESGRLDQAITALAPELRLDVAVAEAGVLANFNTDGVNA